MDIFQKSSPKAIFIDLRERRGEREREVEKASMWQGTLTGCPLYVPN